MRIAFICACFTLLMWRSAIGQCIPSNAACFPTQPTSSHCVTVPGQELPESITSDIIEPFDATKLASRLLQLPRLLPLVYIDAFTTFLREIKKVLEEQPKVLAPKVEVAFFQLLSLYPDFFEILLVGFEVVSANIINITDAFTLAPIANYLVGFANAFVGMDPSVCEQLIRDCEAQLNGGTNGSQ